jgi:hypothetical protein
MKRRPWQAHPDPTPRAQTHSQSVKVNEDSKVGLIQRNSSMLPTQTSWLQLCKHTWERIIGPPCHSKSLSDFIMWMIFVVNFCISSCLKNHGEDCERLKRSQRLIWREQKRRNGSCLERLIISSEADAGDILQPNRETAAAKRKTEHNLACFESNQHQETTSLYPQLAKLNPRLCSSKWFQKNSQRPCY